MERVDKKLRLSEEVFKRCVGTTKAVFQEMMDILQTAYNKLHESGGNPKGLNVGDKLLITLQYYREYRTMELIAADFGCSRT